MVEEILECKFKDVDDSDWIGAESGNDLWIVKKEKKKNNWK